MFGNFISTLISPCRSSRARVAGMLCVVAALAALSPARAQTLDDTAALQTRLKATNEEWSILLPKLRQVVALRSEVFATAGEMTDSSPVLLRRMLDSPLGGTSMDAPVMQNSGVRSLAMALGLAATPFDPKNAPGNTVKEGGGGGGRTGRGFAERFRTTNGNSVQSLLNDLQALLAAKDTTDQQLREKLAEVRATRAKAARDLAAAQQELAEMLTLDESATLVALGYMD